jgi:hypothetical protein
LTPEHESIEAFVEYMVDDEREVFTHADVNAIAQATRTSHHKVREDLEKYGLRLACRNNEKNVRGFSSNPHDRWYGPGSERTHGGSGWEQINGFSGKEG